MEMQAPMADPNTCGPLSLLPPGTLLKVGDKQASWSKQESMRKPPEFQIPRHHYRALSSWQRKANQADNHACLYATMLLAMMIRAADNHAGKGLWRNPRRAKVPESHGSDLATASI